MKQTSVTAALTKPVDDSSFLRNASHYACNMVRRAAYSDRNRDMASSMLVAGTARSGTTWLAEVVAKATRSRLIFEPFHGKYVREFSHFDALSYIEPGDPAYEFQEACARMLSGEIKGRWIDKEVLFLRPQLRVIKAIRANLFLRWFTLYFPKTPMLMLARHPCAVVFSRIHSRWDPREDLDTMLAQRRLVDNHLADHMDVIRDAKTSESLNAVIWCIHHLVPLRQFGPQRLPGVFYEELRADPEREWPRVFAALGRVYSPDMLSLINIKSSTSRLSGKNKQLDWRLQMKPEQIDNVLSVVRRFGLGEIYDDSLMPLSNPFMDLPGLR